jgi:hypothetical protein
MDIGEIHNIINSQVPISGISQGSDGVIVIHYSEGVTEQQKQLGQSLLQQMPLIFAKKDKIAQINADFEQTAAQGWNSGQGFNLGLTSQDVSLLVGLFVLAKEGAALGLNPPPIIDTNGVSHNMTMQELTMLMLQYGQARAQMALADAARRKAVEAATSIEELNQI